MTFCPNNNCCPLRDREEAARVVRLNDKSYCQWDPRGNFIVTLEGTEIVVQHQSPEGNTLQEFRGDGKRKKVARDLCNEIINALAVSDLGAAADLGRQSKILPTFKVMRVEFGGSRAHPSLFGDTVEDEGNETLIIYKI